jgi:hypothetical protein
VRNTLTKLNKAQRKLWDKAQLWAKLHQNIPCCLSCVLSDQREVISLECKRGPMIDFYALYYNSSNSWSMNLLPSKTRRELKVSLCDKYFTKDK